MPAFDAKHLGNLFKQWNCFPFSKNYKEINPLRLWPLFIENIHILTDDPDICPSHRR